MLLRNKALKAVLIGGLSVMALSSCDRLTAIYASKSAGPSVKAPRQVEPGVTDLGIVKLGGDVADKTRVNLAVLVSKEQPRFKISLQANPASTDYAWFETHLDNSKLKLVKYKFQAPPLHDKHGKIITGEPGIQVFEFAATPAMLRQPMITQLKFMLRKMDNEVDAKVANKVVTIEVKSSIVG